MVDKGNKKSFAIVNGKTQEMVMNGEAWEILKLCNGERIVEQIKEDFATRYSYMNPTADFLKDVVVTLFAFDKLWALSWGKGGSPFMVNGTIKLNEKYDLRCVPMNGDALLSYVYEKMKQVLIYSQIPI